MANMLYLTCDELIAQGTTYAQAISIPKFHRREAKKFEKTNKRWAAKHNAIAAELEKEYAQWPK